MSESTLRFEAGILLCGKIRSYLTKAKLAGYVVDWVEGDGWFSREWLIRGDIRVLQDLYDQLKGLK